MPPIPLLPTSTDTSFGDRPPASSLVNRGVTGLCADGSAELVGTAVLMFAVVGAIAVAFRPGWLSAALASNSWRFLFIGMVAGLAVALVAISPLGKRSGAHLNPALTLGFWLRGLMGPAETAGYIVAQMAGAAAGVAAARLVLGAAVASPAVNYGITRPGHGWNDPGAMLGEALLTALMVAAIQLSLGQPRTAPWTPAIGGLTLAALIWLSAPYTGAALNQARGLAPDMVAGRYPSPEVYLLGPTLGAVLGAGLLSLTRRPRPLTTRLCPGACSASRLHRTRWVPKAATNTGRASAAPVPTD